MTADDIDKVFAASPCGVMFMVAACLPVMERARTWELKVLAGRRSLTVVVVMLIRLIEVVRGMVRASDRS
ncbi:hypothetical protein GCM10010361_11330 [Streptomyces olivaceiscleroticus]|uniref:Transposase n=1 Tax=Streptomyces olivaceiscleroticus TaxID=68245 RepID=A0ABN0ZJD9_9ACTN